jgi:hypothetical protein
MGLHFECCRLQYLNFFFNSGAKNMTVNAGEFENEEASNR